MINNTLLERGDIYLSSKTCLVAVVAVNLCSGLPEIDPSVHIFETAMQLALETVKNGENAVLRPMIGFETKQDYIIFSSNLVCNCISIISNYL